jgi:hypothetical protein
MCRRRVRADIRSRPLDQVLHETLGRVVSEGRLEARGLIGPGGLLAVVAPVENSRGKLRPQFLCRAAAFCQRR